MKKLLLLLFTAGMFVKAEAQKDITLTITHKLGANNFAFNTTAQNDLMQNFQITRVDYYISKVSIIHDGGTVTPVPGDILVKGSSNVVQSLGSYNITNVEAIRFSIGVDSPANNEDPSMKVGPLGFQTPSMHWGWSAGYRFVALEGRAGTNAAAPVFELHGLWNRNYFQQTVAVPGIINGNNITINLDADYTQALKGINIASAPIKHGLDEEDLTVLNNFKSYVFKAGSGPTAVNDIQLDKNIAIYPNPSKGKIYIDLSKSANVVSEYRIMDMSGKMVETGAIKNNAIITLKKSICGNYILTLYDKGLAVFTQMIAVQQ